MILLTPDQTAVLKDWFLPERPGPLIGLHVIQSGQGVCFADRWPNPRALLVDTAGNYSLAGDPNAFQPADLKGRIAGFVEVPDPFVPLIKATFPDLTFWDRVIFQLDTQPRFTSPARIHIRRLTAVDAYHLWGLSPEISWISKTWSGPIGLAASGFAWGAFVDGQLVSVACSFFLGIQFEEIGVVTEPAFRGRGLSVACAGALCKDIQDRGRQPSWSTSPDNTGSVRVAEKLGFTLQRRDHLYLIGVRNP